jgi:hypothetical protein
MRERIAHYYRRFAFEGGLLSLNVYLAGPMQGLPEFNFPAFRKAAAYLRSLGYEVFSPAEKDIERHGGKDISKGNATGDVSEAAAKHGFSLRHAMADDTDYLCMEADAIALLPGWEHSKGAFAEWALAKALGHRLIYLTGAEDRV